MNKRTIDAPNMLLPAIDTETTGEKVGYRRVSTGDQNLDRQLVDIIDQLHKVFEDKLSGKDRKRPGLNECIAYLRKGDVLFVHSIDRLARDLRDLQDIIEKIIEKGAGVRFLKENLYFTADDSDSMGKLLLQIMGAFAEFERSMIKERQKEGIKIALDKGVKFGRRNVVTDEIGVAIIELLQSGLSKSAIALQVGVSRQSVYNFLKAIA